MNTVENEQSVIALPAPEPPISKLPRATYRLQLHKNFTFRHAQEILPYLRDLGISHCYLSPIAKARQDSIHGYDSVDPKEINPELGGENAFALFCKEAQSLNMNLVLDVVPNHMCITDSSNRYWQDVLENGPMSVYAKYFDINWVPDKRELVNKVLLPFLGDQYGRILENGEITLTFENSYFWVNYYDFKLPLDPRSWPAILTPVQKKIAEHFPDNDPDRMELESILNGLNYLPFESQPSPDRIRERHREKEILKKRLDCLVKSNVFINETVQDEVKAVNGTKGDSRSFDRLEALLAKQFYRLCNWKVAADEINYRRFFDINELAAIRMEDEDVFREIHRPLLDLIMRGSIQGLRIDHIDGLLDPERYLIHLQNEYRATTDTHEPLYIVVEKILSRNESLDEKWPIAGTTGYDFINIVNGLYVDTVNSLSLERFYRKFSHQTHSFSEHLITSKKLIMLVSMAGELRMLSLFLDAISEQHRWSRDFTHEGLRFALREVIAYFPVYRTYIREEDKILREDDIAVVNQAVNEAKRRNPSTSESIFDFIGSVLTLTHPDGLSDAEKIKRFEFVQKFQQFTGPVMAKGLEDTGFYRYMPLLSLNEVGGRPDQFGITRKSFHESMMARQEHWPGTLSASSTHDTKRSEDVRARINVLSEIPVQWGKAVRTWHNLNLIHKAKREDQQVPDTNEEYMLYQTLLGTWPINDADKKGYVKRIQEFFLKALREAKINSSWVRPNVEYEKSALEFVEKILDPVETNAFMKSFEEFNRSILTAGLFNALSQTLLKLTLPGVPDFYQGTEMWNFSLVDPDNRRAVNYPAYKEMLASLNEASKNGASEELVQDLMNNLHDGRMKMYLMQEGLQLRRDLPLLFQQSKYHPLVPEGQRRRSVIAFCRERDNEAIIGIAGRFFLEFDEAKFELQNEIKWGDTTVQMPGELRGHRWKHVLTGKIFEVETALDVKNVLGRLPIALLKRLS